MKVSLSIIIVNYNVTDLLEKCLQSIFSPNQELPTEVIVIDNNSSDGGSKRLAEKFPEVIQIDNRQNLGFAKACNQGLGIAAGDYVLFLNPDTVIKDGALDRCTEFIHANPVIGLLGCKLLNSDGSLQPSCADFPYIHRILLDHLLRAGSFPDSIREKLLLRFWSHDRIREVDWFIGAFMLGRADLIKGVGGFDEDYFLYGEDLDLCYRIKNAGWRVVFFPNAEVLHVGNPLWDPQRLALVYDALLIFYGKHLPLLMVPMLRFIMRVTLFLRKKYGFIA